MKKFYTGLSVLVLAVSFCFSAFAYQADYAEIGFQNDSELYFVLIDTDAIPSVQSDSNVLTEAEIPTTKRTMGFYLINNPEPTHPAAKWNALPYEVGWRS